LGGYSLQV